jgi:hypothetical protein
MLRAATCFGLPPPTTSEAKPAESQIVRDIRAKMKKPKQELVEEATPAEPAEPAEEAPKGKGDDFFFGGAKKKQDKPEQAAEKKDEAGEADDLVSAMKKGLGKDKPKR